MSDLSNAADRLKVPEEILQRSAAARAVAAGSDADAVLSAWAGGGSAPSSAPAAEQTPQEAAATTEVDESVEGPAPSSQPTTASAPAPAVPHATGPLAPATPRAGSVVVQERQVEFPAEPVPVGRRIRLAARSGAIAGTALALFGWVFAAQFYLAQSTVFGEENAQRAGIQVDRGKVVLYAMVISVAIGILVAGIARAIPGFMGRGMRLRTPAVASGAVGGIVGLMVGGIVGALLVGSGTPIDTLEGFSDLPILGSVIWSMVLWAGGGWLVGAAVQGLAIPNSVADEESDELTAVSRRLGAAFGIPVAAALSILVLVLAMAYAFISFPAFAPLTGAIAAGAILGLAAISASKPSIRVRRSDVLAGALGVAAVLVLVVSLLTFLVPQEEHAEEEPAEGAETEEVVGNEETAGGEGATGSTVPTTETSEPTG